MPVVIILLFIIAMAVAPQAILNICRLIDAVFNVLLSVVGLALCVGFFWFLLLGRGHG